MKGVNLPVAKRYATALFELAKEKGLVEEIDQQAMYLEKKLSDPEVRRFIQHPEISLEAKLQFIQELFEEPPARPLLELIRLMLRRGRAADIQAVLDYYDILTDRYRGVEDVVVESAVELTEEEKQELLAVIKKFSDYNFRTTFRVNPDLLGGLVVYLGRDRVIDGSLSTALKELYELLNAPEARLMA